MTHSPHDVDFIDLTGDSNGEEEQDKFLDSVQPILIPPISTGAKQKRNHGSLKTTGLAKNEGRRFTICLDDSSDDEEFYAKTPPTFKKFKPDDTANKVKLEFKREREKPVARISIVEDGLEIVENAGPKMVPVASNAYLTNNDDDDVIVEGVTNEVRLPHLRQDCTNRSFKEYRMFKRYSLSSSEVPIEYLDSNEKSCDLCYCFVCDCPVKDCKKWRSGVSRAANLNHCCAVNTVALWENFRKEERRTRTTPAAAVAVSSAVRRSTPAAVSSAVRRSTPAAVSPATPSPAAAATTGGSSITKAPPGYHFVLNCLVSGCTQCWCYVCDAEADNCDDSVGHRSAYDSHYWRLQRERRKLSTYGRTGPFPPDTADASKDPHMKQCRKCSWYFRREKAKNHREYFDDWCPYCGRVALDADFSKRQAKVRDAKDLKKWFTFDEKVIPFRVHAHDPRLFYPYKANWDKNPEWQYDEADRQVEVFLHLVGERPYLSKVFDRLANTADDRISKTADHVHKQQNVDAIILEEPGHFNLIQCLSSSFYRDYVDVSASWDRQLGSGVFKVRLILRKSFLFGKKPNNSSQSFLTKLPGILALWFGFKLDMGDLSYRMELSQNSFNSQVEQFKNSNFEVSKCKDAVLQFVNSKAEEIRASHASYSDSLSLSSSQREGGGVSTSDTSIKACFTSFYREQLPDYIDTTYDRQTFQYLVETCKGELGNKRSAWYKDHMDLFVALCGGTDAMVYKLLLQEKSAAPSDRLSINEVMVCLENLGHESEFFVEGLNVELLDFQKQALKWAMEREQTPGGIQSYYWPKLPSRVREHGDLYFNPVLNQFRKDKPVLVRGGILAAEMGLGKTLISLALILKNPAPAFPKACSSVSLLNSAPKSSTGEGWDVTLYGRTSSQNSKRGSIISRGTLVICPVSLVGQWIEEAKTRLSNPQLIYPYHGQNRKRDAKKLAEAAIVVTTYQVLASDNTYHNTGDGYCAPLEQVRWWRIIADEGHTLRESNTQKSHAVKALVADNKWIVTGTPISTDPKEVRNLFDFLGIEESSKMFGEASTNVLRRRNRDETKLGLLMFLLRPVLLRYSQKQTYRKTGTTLMSLPPMSKRTIDVEFSSAEKREFDKLEKAAQDFYLDFRRRHFKDMSMHFLKLSSKLMPLRVALAGGKYPLSDTADESPDDCESTDYDNKTDGEAVEAVPRSSKKQKDASYSDFAFTSKANVLLAELKRIRDKEPDSKSLIFSQFPSTLEHLQELLPSHGFSFRTLKGSMSMKQRAKALHDFQNDPPTTVFLLSMRSGAVGINLTQANRVFLMEPGFNPALEAQAIGRVHRLGQKRNVEICRLVIKDSFESRMVGFMKKKYKLSFDDVESDERKSNGSGASEVDGDVDSEKDTKAPGQVIVGNLQTDRAQVVTEEFDELFGVQDLLAKYAEEQDESMDGHSVSPDAAMSGYV